MVCSNLKNISNLSHLCGFSNIFVQSLAVSEVIYFFTRLFKGIDRPFGGGVESRLILSVVVNWRLGKNFFISF